MVYFYQNSQSDNMGSYFTAQLDADQLSCEEYEGKPLHPFAGPVWKSLPTPCSPDQAEMGGVAKGAVWLKGAVWQSGAVWL